MNGFDPILEMPGQIFEDEDAVNDTFNEFERNQGNPGKIENVILAAIKYRSAVCAAKVNLEI